MKKENKAIKNRVIRYIRNFFVHEEKKYYKRVRICNFWNNKYIEYENNNDIDYALLVEDCS